MVIIVSDNLIINRHTERNFSIFFSNMMTAYREGKHIIIISPRSIKKLLYCNEITSDSKIILNHYNNHNKSVINILQYVKIVINVVSSSKESKIYTEINSRIEYRELSLDNLIDSSSIQKSILLGENGKDVILYSLFAKYYLLNKKNDYLFINFKPQSGGGTEVEKEYKTIYFNREEFCLCIVDSDKRAPNFDFGKTAKNILNFTKSVSDANLNVKCHLVILETLEVENLIPDNFYTIKYNIDVNKKYIISILNKLYKDDYRIKDFFDYKKGIVCKGVCDNCKPERKYYLCPLAKRNNLSVNNNRYLQGFGDKILEDFIEYDDKYADIDKDSRVKSQWLEIGKTVASFTLSTPVIRVI